MCVCVCVCLCVCVCVFESNLQPQWGEEWKGEATLCLAGSLQSDLLYSLHHLHHHVEILSSIMHLLQERVLCCQLPVAGET